eukprot:TRINITY_DN14435_c0_g4_i2.p2 TRINITY_DN14435_c0_g4~~TRINITY_DN14435_c0_g4_i2.p2  ORF type:complete len:113 (-),score=1.60 TRINITY_DN14435_c0_g4_i2:57-395(-)
MLAHHAATGAGGHHNRPVFRKQSQLCAGDRAGFIVIAGGVGGLATAGLVFGVDDLNAFPLQQLDAGHACVRVEHVDQAGAVEIDLGRFGRVNLDGINHSAVARDYYCLSEPQ